MMKNFIKLVMFSMFLVFMVGCAKEPTSKLNDVKGLIEAAKVAEADRYLPTEYNALLDSLNLAVSNIEKEKSKFFLVRNYNDVVSTLNNTMSLADTVKNKAVLKKEETKNETLKLIDETNVLVSEIESLVKKAPRGKEGIMALEQIKSELDVIVSSINETKSIFDTGDYLTAFNKIKASNDASKSIKLELENAINKTRK